MTFSFLRSFPGYFTLTILLSTVLLGSCKKDFTEKAVNAAEADVSADRLASNKPNIILIIGDDVGYEIPTYSGGGSYNTSNLDFMAANGMQFNNCYSHPDGSPSRLALMTGKYSFRNYEKWGYLPPGEKTIGNMLQDAGYATCYTGKWQLDGGDASIKMGGFDKYRVFLPFGTAISHHDQRYRRYKSPYLYENGAYMPDSVVEGKYSEDLFYEYASNFIDSNRNRPFFMVYACNLPATPWVPTPDDPEFASWDPNLDTVNEDRKYFPSMVAYMDKTIGKLISKIDQKNLSNRTVFIFTSDNTTNKSIQSIFNDTLVRGGKNYTTKAGTNVPLVLYCKGRSIAGGKLDTSLIDMTDFLPTIADIARVPRPTNYGTLDGKTFYDNLTRVPGEQRDWVFCHWDNDLEDAKIPQRYVHNYDYKLYDSIDGGKFYNLRTDVKEKKPIGNHNLTQAEKDLKVSFQAILDSMH